MNRDLVTLVTGLSLKLATLEKSWDLAVKTDYLGEKN